MENGKLGVDQIDRFSAMVRGRVGVEMRDILSCRMETAERVHISSTGIFFTLLSYTSDNHLNLLRKGMMPAAEYQGSCYLGPIVFSVHNS